jgi:alpha-ribazole phosphatase
MLLIRHAPSVDGGCMAGRRDVDADLCNLAAIGALRARLGAVGGLLISPARRCVQTADAVLPGMPRRADPRLWEQDFGAWEGVPYANLPDLGTLSTADLAAYAPPQGESFRDMCARSVPALADCTAGDRVAIVAHAGIIRAAIGHALGDIDAGLAFHIAPLSLTHIAVLPGGQFAIQCVNWTAA